jgi:tRNA A37 threonylcarbamoyladenosine synthetase subunit TsaC/SUA5/YrdC
VIVLPTDTVYGLGLLLGPEASPEPLFGIKGRDLEKAIPLLVGEDLGCGGQFAGGSGFDRNETSVDRSGDARGGQEGGSCADRGGSGSDCNEASDDRSGSNAGSDCGEASAGSGERKANNAANEEGGQRGRAVLSAWALEPPEYALRLAQCHWPGPLTLIVRAAAAIPAAFRAADGSVALRMPKSPVALALLRAAGAPIATTSANLQGRSAATAIDQLDPQIAAQVALILDAGPTPLGSASTIVSCLGPTPAILRQGALDLSA